MTKDSNGK